jgi:sterol desaturase/sphingolipid hydroxylase (fatty acid hydroxylase superfamily)
MKRALALAAVFAGLVWLERRYPLRPPTRPRGRRLAINVGMTAVTAVAVGALQSRTISWATGVVADRRLGLARVRSHALRRLLGVVALDYTLWHWHRWNHRVPLLWRMHAAHHADPDLDASTALRFHAGEMLASVPFRAAQVLALGIDRDTLRTWETLLLVAILFHHSNTRLPPAFDKALSHLIITPRLHGIHHSFRPDRLDTNFGTLLSLWDALHGTRDASLARAQHDLAIGIPALPDRPTLSLCDSLRLAMRSDLADA